MKLENNKMSPTVNMIVEYIEERIQRKELRPGDKLPTESEFCKLLNVSRTSVREAIKVLSAQTIINIKRGAGTYISQPEEVSFHTPLLFKMLLSEMTWKEIVDFREQIELLVLLSCIRNADETVLQRIHVLNSRFTDVCRNNPTEYDVIVDLECQIHQTLGRGSGNRLLEEIYAFMTNVFIPMTLFAHKSHVTNIAEDSIRDHQALEDILANHDILTALYVVRQGTSQWLRSLESVDKDVPFTFFS